MFIYRLRIDTVKDENGHDHKVYGVDVFKHIRSIPDIFTQKKKAKRFIVCCNKLQPASVHIDDVVYDAMVK